MAAFSGSRLIGGVAAYALPKFEQARTELYLYDLAVDAAFRPASMSRSRDEAHELADARIPVTTTSNPRASSMSVVRFSLEGKSIVHSQNCGVGGVFALQKIRVNDAPTTGKD